jgi:DNA recombination protein RmuC
MAENAQAISALGQDLHDRVRKFAEHFDALRGGLEKAVDSYNKAAGTLESRVLVTARKFKELGAASGDEIEEIAVIDKTPRETRLLDSAKQ